MAGNKSSADFASISWLDDNDWVYTPTQNRSKKTLQKILVTAKTLFIRSGFEQTTIADISKHSSVSVGSIYNLFADKNAIFLALYEHYRITRVAQIEQMIESRDWHQARALDVVRFHIDIIFSSSKKDAGFLRLVERQRTCDAVLDSILVKVEEQFCQTMLALYQPLARHFTHPDLATAVRYVHYVIRGSALWSMFPPASGGQFLDISNKQYQDETIRMACGYLGVEEGE